MDGRYHRRVRRPPDEVKTWVCSSCGARYGIEDVDSTCPACGPEGLLDLAVDHERLRSTGAVLEGPLTLWRYLPLLPLSGPTRVRADVGGTPLIEAPGLAGSAGVASVHVKDEGRNPSGSLKDRASAVVVARALELGHRRVVTSSSGNAAIALAACCAATGVRPVAFVPADVPRGKLAQLVAYGAEVVLVEDGYERAVTASTEASARWGWYSRNTASNPFTAQGKKTVALEIAEQAGEVDVVLVPTGDGNIITGVHAGFADAVALGWLPRMPRLVAVQAAGADSVYDAWVRGLEVPEPRGGTSSADSINVAEPQDGRRALRAVRQTEGGVVRVDEDTIPDATSALARGAGVFSEPAAATAWAGLLVAREQGLVGKGDRVVLLSTGNGLKDPSQVSIDPARVHRLATGAELDVDLAP